ncbi:unnamed protein product, partial [Symbiodinium pilosum]
DALQNGSTPCLMLALRQEPILSFWPFGFPDSAVALPLSPRLPPWKKAAGAVLPCHELRSLVEAASLRCLLLAGWDGKRLRVAVVKLAKQGLLPEPGEQVAVRSEVPLASSGCISPDAMHVDASGQLWLAEAEALAAWHLPSGTFLGRWRPSWPGLRPSALCTHGERLLVAGGTGLARSETFGRPILLSFRPNLTESQSAPKPLQA